MFADGFWGGNNHSSTDLFAQTFNNFFQTGVEPFFRFQANVGRRLISPMQTTLRDSNSNRSNPIRLNATARSNNARQREANLQHSEYDILPANQGFRRGRGHRQQRDEQPVRINRDRNQWYDPNGQYLLPEPISIAPTYMTLDEINNIPTYVYKGKIKKSKLLADQKQVSIEEADSKNNATACAAVDAAKNNQESTNNMEENVPKECDICICDFKAGDVIKPLACDHEFHRYCLDEWLRKRPNCPKCRLGVKAGFRRLERQKKKQEIAEAKERIRKRNEQIASLNTTEVIPVQRSYATPSRITLKKGSNSVNVSVHLNSNSELNSESVANPSTSIDSNNNTYYKRQSGASNSVNSTDVKQKHLQKKAFTPSRSSAGSSSRSSPKSARLTEVSSEQSLASSMNKLTISEKLKPTDSHNSQSSSSGEKCIVSLSISPRVKAVEAAIKRQEEFKISMNNNQQEICNAKNQ